MPISFLRRAIPLGATVAVSALLLSSCAAPSSESDGGELVWSIEGANLSAGHMDPQVSQLDVSGMVQRAVLDSLVFQEDDGSFCLLYTSPSPRDQRGSRMPSSA